MEYLILSEWGCLKPPSFLFSLVVVHLHLLRLLLHQSVDIGSSHRNYSFANSFGILRHRTLVKASFGQVFRRGCICMTHLGRACRALPRGVPIQPLFDLLAFSFVSPSRLRRVPSWRSIWWRWILIALFLLIIFHHMLPQLHLELGFSLWLGLRLTLLIDRRPFHLLLLLNVLLLL